MKSYRFQYPISAPSNFCDYSEGPDLRKGDHVALYFGIVSGKLHLVDWFLAEEAIRSDPRLTAGISPMAAAKSK